MRIVQILPGSGDRFYCENCVRDNAVVRALKRAGEDVVAVPMYLPPIIERVDGLSDAPVFFGGINAYLQQKSGFFRKTPRWLDRIFDARFLLRIAARRAGSVRARGLGEMTLSILQGTEGNQAKELRRLVRWLEGMEKPHAVHLSTSLLLGIGREIKKSLGVPLVCSLQDEDVWVDAMEPAYRDLCWKAMEEGAREVEAFVVGSRYYGGVMRDRLGIPPDRLHVVPIGVEAGDPPPAASADPPALGYLARMSEGMGLGTLADAFLLLKKREGFRDLRLHLSGGSTGDDTAFLEELRRKFAAEGVERDVAFFEEFDPAARRRFFCTLTLLSVPAPRGAAFGTYILESLAAGVPVVQPRLGSFPELVEGTGGGVLYEPNDAGTLARVLGDLLPDRGRRSELARKGRESVVKSFGLDTMARGLIAIYGRIVPGGRP
jgi:glycosyltransferase involved in cell wall biosynthesis